MHRELAGLDDRELLDIGSLPRFSQQRITACELLVGRHRGLVWSCVQRYWRGPDSAEDLMQVGYVGLVGGDQQLRSGRRLLPGHLCPLAY